ncbi:hypothetical protein Nepgr_018626 [Nepenthes gracilis]|uniref:Uncharacterized protein n=1 Tax=Nepenthes gracilis TaxID=150966 RepID=A0AAD3XUF9_NEPGR|nr:hypothetical protein Nepgr_018626 [Nepenthes gracilis]
MGLRKFLRVILLCWVLSVFYCLKAVCDDASEVTVKFLKAPPSHSNMKSATFVFEALAGNNEETFSLYTFNCKLDGGISSDCRERHVSFSGLLDGNHTFKVCANTSQGVGCASYNWTVDTIPPTAYVGASTTFTNASNISVYISFSEPCIGAGGGFRCFSANACNLLVYGAGQVIPYTLKILQPNLKYSVIVNLSSTSQHGRAILVMDKGFCTDYAGNKFTRTENSSLTVHFDRRSVFVRMRTHVPERLLQINDETRTVQATNNYKYLKLYLYFTQPVLNTSYEILNTLTSSEGMLHPIAGKSLMNRRFGYRIENLSSIAVVTVRLNSNAIISRQGTPVSPVAPATFLYDSKRPAVTLSAFSKMRTRETSITILIKFVKPVFGFNSTAVSISGGHLRSFHEISRNAYVAMIQPK